MTSLVGAGDIIEVIFSKPMQRVAVKFHIGLAQWKSQE